MISLSVDTAAYLFTDDTNIFWIIKDEHDHEKNSGRPELHWEMKQRMASKNINICALGKRSKQPIVHTVTYGTNLEEVAHEKDIWVIIDDNLNFDDHVQAI